MIKKKNKYWYRFWLIVLLMGCINPNPVKAQSEQKAKSKARQLMHQGDYEKALPILKELYQQAPFEKAIYEDYLDALIKTKKYQQADSLIGYMRKIRRQDVSLYIDFGKVANSAGHKRKAQHYFDTALALTPHNTFKIKNLAKAFEEADFNQYAIRVFLKARQIQATPYAYATQLSFLYQKEGNYKKAINALLDVAMHRRTKTENFHASLLQMAANEKHGLEDIKSALNKRIKKQPQNPVWQQLLSWVYLQNGDFKGALKNLITLDKEFKENGKSVLPFAKNATKSGQYTVSRKAYDYVIELGKSENYYSIALSGRLHNGLAQLENQHPPHQELVDTMLQWFKTFFQQFPQFKIKELWRQYAKVEARYNNNPDTAVLLLKQVIGNVRAGKNFVGRCKLDMGDYYLLTGKIWNATLMYSQVNKTFEQDRLGEKARFKNAKWAFYKGDFSLAQHRLSILKASTSKLIANDALNLSILITENTPSDSILTPLKRYAAADLLRFKNQTQEADNLLDSIAKAWPKSPLQDNIALLRGEIAARDNQWEKAEKFYKIVLNKYGHDVLGDDAAWRLAELYRKKIKNPQKSLKYYKVLIIKYPGSTFVQEARKWYDKLSPDVKPSEL